MAKRLFSLVMMMTLAVCAWAQDVTTVSSQTLWTFDSYEANQTGVHEYQGIYLHSATGSSTFSTDSEHAASTTGSFSNNDTWTATAVLTSNLGCSLSSVSGITAESTSAPDGSLAISLGRPGKLYVVYGATTTAGGKFYINSGDGTAQESDMAGIKYTGVLGTRASYNYTQAETSIELTSSGTVYLGGSVPYCIYAILFVPTIDYPDIYGTYDFQTWAEANLSSNVQATIDLNNGIMTGFFSNMKDGAEAMTLNSVFSIVKGTSGSDNDVASFKLRKNGSTGNGSSGILFPRVSASKVNFTINRLQNGDWFKIETGTNHIQFATENANIKAANSTSSVKAGDEVIPGTIYLVSGATSAAFCNAIDGGGTSYIYSIKISDEDGVSAPVINVDANNQVSIDGGTSLKGNAVKVYYTRDNSDPTTSDTKQEYTGPFTPTKTEIIRAYSVLASDESVASEEAEPKAVRIGTWTGETNVFDFAAAAENLIDITFGDKLEGVKMYGGGSSPDASANFYPITNTDWLTASEGNSAVVAWREKGATFANGGLIPNGQTYFTIANLTEGQRIQIEYYGRLRYRTNVADDAPVVLDESETAIATDTYFGTKNQESTTTFTIQSGSYMVFLCENNDVVIKKITVLEPLPTYTLTIGEMENGTVTDAEGNALASAYKEDTEVTVVAQPAENFKFNYWEVNGVKDTEHTTATLTLTMTANTTVKAYFADARVSAEGVPVIIVAGQSNTDGRIRTSETAFPFTLNHTLMSYCNGDVNGSYPVVDEGNFVAYGSTPRSDAGECWGYDAIIYNKVQEELGNTDFYVIKQSKGNTAVNAMSTSGNNQHWWSANPVWLDRNTSANQGGRSLLLALKDNIDKSLKALTDAGKEYDIKFLMWHQGEADRGKGAEYETQLKAVINYVRNYLVEHTGNNKYSNLPVVLGGIADVSSEYKAEVEAGKQSIAAEDANVYYAPTGTMTLDTDFRSDKVHFNATGAEKLATAVWDIITTNHLLTGITLAGDDTPVANPLAEEVVSETTMWNFTTTGALTEHQSQNGLYNHRGTVNQRDYGTIILADGSEIDGTYAALTTGADRKTSCTQGLTAGYGGLTNVYSVNVDGEGTFITVLRPINMDNGGGYARLMLNGEELQAVQVTSTEENIQLVGKTTGKGTFAVTCGERWDFIGAKFIKGATTIEMMTAPTIEAGSALNAVKINPGTSDQSGTTIKTYYTTDGTTPSTESQEYDGTEIKLTEDCTVRAVSVSSKGGSAYSEPYTFTYEAPAPNSPSIVYDLTKMVDDSGASKLEFDETIKTVYVSEAQSDGTRKENKRNFYAATNLDSKISVREGAGSVQVAGGAIRFTRAFAFHNLGVGDEIIIRYSGGGTLQNATPSTANTISMNGSTLNAGDAITAGSTIRVTAYNKDNNYIVLQPSGTVVISAIYINKEEEVDDETATNFYIAPDGDDSNRGTLKSSAFKTLKKAQERASAGSIIHILPGTYQVTSSEYMDRTSSGAWNIVYNLNKDNIQYIGEPDENGQRPVFDFGTLEVLDNKRITGFYLTAQDIVIKNIETIGIKVATTESNTQSENFRLNGAVNCTLKNIAAHNGQGVGFYITGNSKGNTIEDCDAYENIDVTNRYNSSSGRYAGENNDGFGCHVNANCPDNKFIRCRAWLNADDGFDLIKCYSVATIEECIAYMNGWATYPDGNVTRSGNGNGMKAGGYGKGAITLPEGGAPIHVVKNSIAASNPAGGFYANHHLGGLQLEGNRAYMNGTDYRLTNRSLESAATAIGSSDDESESSEDAMNQPGYSHILMNNLAYGNTNINKVIADIDPEKCTVAGNTFSYTGDAWTNAIHSDADFASVDVSLLTKSRDADGNLASDVFSFLKLNEEGEGIESPIVAVASEKIGKVTYNISYPADAELHYTLPGESEEKVTTDGTAADGKKAMTLEVGASGDMKLYAQKGGSVSSIVTISVTIPEPTAAVTFDFVAMAKKTTDLGMDNGTKTTRYFSEKSSDGTVSDKSGNFYSIGASPVSGVISWREKDVELTSSGLKPTKDARPFAIHGLQEGDIVRIEFTGDIYYAKHSEKGDALADMEAGTAITSMTAYTIGSVDTENSYVMFYPTKATVISRISINPVTASKPAITEPTEENSDGSKTYTVTIGEGETLHYTTPDKEGEQAVTYAETDNGTCQITVTESGTLSCWTTKEGAETPSETVTVRVTLTKDEPTEKITIHTIGDSTMSSYDQSIPAQAGMDGWGDYLADCLKPEWATVYNWADRGETAKSYYNGIWLKTSSDRPEFAEPVMNKIKTGDYVILQFGHNDSKAYSTADYETWMGTLVDAVKAKGATPIIASSICRRRFENGEISLLGQINSIEDTKGRVPATAVTGDEHEYDYPYHAMLVAKAKGIEFIDVTAGTKALYEEYGEDKSAAFFPGSEKTHTNQLGAQTIAKVVVQILYDDNTSLKKYVNTDALTMPDKESIEVVIESFGKDEVVTKKTIWTFNDYQDGDVIADKVTCIDGLYVRGGSGNADGLFKILAKSSPVSSVTFSDDAKTKVNVSMSATTLNANDYADKVGYQTAGRADANGFTRMFALNIGTPGTFYAKVGAETANKSIKLVFSGVTKEVVTTDGSVNDLTFKAETTGVIYICANTPFALYAAMFVPDMEKGTEEDWNYQMVQTRASGYWTYSNLSGGNQSVADGLTVYAVTAIDEEGKATLEDIGKVIPAGEGFLVKGAPNTEYALPSTTDAATYTGTNLMAANDELRFLPETENGMTNYYFDGTKFVKSTGSETIHEKQAYLNVASALSEIEIEGVEEPESGVKNATMTLTDDSRKDRKVYTAVFEEGQKLYYKRPGQDTDFRSANYKEEGITITVQYNGDLEYYVTQTIDKVLCYSDTTVISVSTIAKKPTVTYQRVDGSESIYQIIYSKGTTLHYSIADGSEQTVADKDTIDIKVSATGMAVFYSTNDYVTSDTTSTRVYAPTPAIVQDSVYLFSTLRNSINADYIIGGLNTGEKVKVNDETLYKPDDVLAKTLDRFAFSPLTDSDGKKVTDWRLLNAGRLRATKSGNEKCLAILDVKENDYVCLTYSGASIVYDSTGTCKLGKDISAIESKKNYQAVTSGTLLLSIPADTLNNCDITVISVSSTPYSVSDSSSSSSSTDSSSSSDAVTIKAVETNDSGEGIYYRFEWKKGDELFYVIGEDGEEQSAGTSGVFELLVTEASTIKTWTVSGNTVSKVTTTGLFMPLLPMTYKGNFDFAESSEELPADLEVTLNSNKQVNVGGQKLYMPSLITEELFDDRFAFSEITSKNKIRIRRNRTLMFSKGDDVQMGILNLKQGDRVALDYSGVIRMQNSSDAVLEPTANARTRAASSNTALVSGETYIMQRDGDLLLNVALADSSVTVNKIYVGPITSASEPGAFDFVTAAEEFETIETERPANVYYYNKEKAQVFRYITNNSENLPIDYKISTEGGNGTLAANGLMAGNRRLAIHSLGAGDEIKLRFTGGAVTYEGHDNGCAVSVNGRRLTPQDTLRSGDVIRVEKVDYLYNYLVLKLDSKVSVSGIYINTAETEKVSMPTIVDKGSNTVLITAGQSSTGNAVTTCYTTDGSEPTKLNGTSGPYDEIEVQLLSGGIITIKSVSFTDGGLYSKVASLTIFADELTNGRNGLTRGATGTYDMQGNKVETVSPGKLYIRDGKVVFFGKETK